MATAYFVQDIDLPLDAEGADIMTTDAIRFEMDLDGRTVSGVIAMGIADTRDLMVAADAVQRVLDHIEWVA